MSSGAPALAACVGATRRAVAGELTERLGRAELLWSRVSREPEATFAAARYGGAAVRRPDALSEVARAGAWTATGWPATMEGALRSGRAAARVLLASGAVTAGASR